MRVVFVTIFILISFGISVLYAARWSEWQDLTLCNAKPCRCKGYKREKCAKGKKVEIRTCIREEGDTSVCKWKKGVGAIRLNTKCKNKNVCPGWSDWMPVGKCICERNIRLVKRLCNNPAPIHADILCIDENTDEKKTEHEMEEYCECTEEEKRAARTTTTSTTTTTPLPTTPLPCCEDYDFDFDYDYREFLEDTNSSQTTTTTTTTTTKTTTSKPMQIRKLLQYIDINFYDSIIGNQSEPDCRPCGNINNSGWDYGDYDNNSFSDFQNTTDSGVDHYDNGNGGDYNDDFNEGRNTTDSGVDQYDSDKGGNEDGVFSDDRTTANSGVDHNDSDKGGKDDDGDEGNDDSDSS